jgi:hypothetical protein
LRRGFGFGHPLYKVPDNIDTFISVLQRISRLNAWGAMFASATATSGLCLFFLANQF